MLVYWKQRKIWLVARIGYLSHKPWQGATESNVGIKMLMWMSSSRRIRKNKTPTVPEELAIFNNSIVLKAFLPGLNGSQYVTCSAMV